MNRHTRLHNRKDEDGPTAKVARKKKGPSASPASQPIDLQPANAALPPPSSPPKASTSLSYPFTFPINPPNFPAYTRPYVGEASSALPLEPSFMPMRRYSDVAYGTTLPSLHPPLGRPRANTLAGLPEALGSFSLVNSPESSGALDSDSSDGDDDEKDQTWMPSAGEEKDLPESQYPSPAFTSYSPTDLQRDTIQDLEAILANDPLHSNNASLFNPAVQPPDEFDFESFAASVEGPTPGNTLEDLLQAAAVPPTPTSGLMKPALLPHHQPQNHLEFDFAATFAAADRQRREQQQQHHHHQQQHQHQQSSSAMPAFSIPSSHSLPTPSSFTQLHQQHQQQQQQQHHQQSPHLTFPTTNTSYPTSAFASAFVATSYPSLMAVPNGLGLSSTSPEPHQALLEAYRKRSLPPLASTPTSSPAFYIPSAAPEPPSSSTGATNPVLAAAPSMTPAARFSLPVPVWSSAARDGAERGETSSFLVV